MIKRLAHWKTVLTLSVLLLVFLLFQVLKSDFMALPDSGFSRGFLLDEIQIEKGYENFYADHFTTLVKDDRIYLISSDVDGLKIKTFDPSIKLLDEFTLSEYMGLSEFDAHFKGNQLVLDAYMGQSGELLSLNINLEQKNATVEYQRKLEPFRALSLAPEFALYGTDDGLKLTTQSNTYVLDHPQYLETLACAVDPADGSTWIAYTEFVDSQYQLNLKHIDKSYQTLSDYKPLFAFGASGAMMPHELSMNVTGDGLQILSVITDKKSGINTAYLIKAPKTDPKDLTSAFFNAYTYSLQPNFYESADEVKLIVSAKTNIGRVEIGANGSFQNLVTMDLDLNQALSLTKSTSPALAPKMMKIGNYDYLAFLQINQNEGKIMLSANEPSLIERSLSSSFSENMGLLMTALTTFLPLSYIGLIVEAYILTPVMVVVVLLSMFFLTWSERNGNKLLLGAIAIHMVAKNYFIWQHMIKTPEVFSNFPAFLDSPLKLFGWGLLMSASALYCLWSFKKNHAKAHYLYQYFFFNIIDVILFTMLFTPYYLLT